MSGTAPTQSFPPRPKHHFDTTNWTLVRQAANPDDEIATEALNTLCKAYWLPVYAYIRSRGRNETDAQDLTQGVFERLLEQNAFAKVDPSRGRLRSYLLGAAKNHLASEHEKEKSIKRGGGRLHLSLDTEWAEHTLDTEMIDDMTPDRIYQRVWARTIVDFAFQLLEEQFAHDGKSDEFEILRPTLGLTAMPLRSYAELAEKTGLTVEVWKTRVHRFRKQWREVFRQQVALTLGNASEENIKAELAELIDFL